MLLNWLHNEFLGFWISKCEFRVWVLFQTLKKSLVDNFLCVKRKVRLILTTKYRKRTLFQFSHKNMFHGVERYIAHSPDDICQKFSRSQTYPLSITFWGRKNIWSYGENIIYIIGNSFGKISPWSHMDYFSSWNSAYFWYS